MGDARARGGGGQRAGDTAAVGRRKMIGYKGRAVARATVGIIVAVVCSVHVRALRAQQPTPAPSQRTQPPRRGETIEIRGQVPTPQVVTVRPREAPAYSRRVL